MIVRLNKHYSLDIKKFLGTVLKIILIMWLILDFKASINNSDICKPKKIEYEEYIVKSGDTLWKIAENFYPERDNREIVYMLKKDNFCNSNLEVGQVLKIKKLLN